MNGGSVDKEICQQNEYKGAQYPRYECKMFKLELVFSYYNIWHDLKCNIDFIQSLDKPWVNKKLKF